MGKYRRLEGKPYSHQMIIALKAPLHICVLEPNIKASLAVKLSLQNADKHTTYILSDIS